MKNIDITILCVMIAFSLYFAFTNLFKRFRFSENTLFVLFNISGTVIYLILLFQILNININFSYFHRIYFSLLILSFQIIISIFHVFPKWEKKSPGYLFLLTQIPGIALIILTLSTDKIILNTAYNNGLINSYGKLIYIYTAVFVFYIILFLFLSIRKYKTLKNKLFKGQIVNQIISLLFGLICFTMLFIMLPLYYDNHYYTIAGLAILSFIPAFIMNYSLSGEKYYDIKFFYSKTVVWILLLAGLVIPGYFFFELTILLKLADSQISLIIASVILSLYLFLFFYLLKPLAYKIINKKSRKLSAIFTEINTNISRFSNIKKQLDWSIFFKQGIDFLCEKLSIKNASFFLQTDGSNFELIHQYGKKQIIQQISVKHIIVSILEKYKQIIEKSLLFTDPKLRESRNELFGFFIKHELDIILPVFLGNDELKALLILGNNNKKKSFSTKDYIDCLEGYRLHLKTLLEKILFSEEVRKTQISKRDKMVIRNIKKRIIPAKFDDIKGLKVSSIFMDNSEFGGDYFNTVKMNDNKAGLFMANTSDLGIESILLALQINSVFQSQAQAYESPEILMNNLNQVLCSSRFTDKYATSIYLIYDSSEREIAFSNAAFNPLLIYDPRKESFSEFDAEGIPTGIDIGFRYKHRSTFAPVDSIGILYSNGLVSAFNKEGNNYSSSRLKDIIKINKNDEPSLLIKKIYNDFKSFINKNTLLNDVSIIVFRAE